MTKQEEIDTFRGFVAGLPRSSYLADILADAVAEVERQIRDDLALPGTMGAILEAKRQEAERHDQLRIQTREAERRLARLQSAIDQAEGRLRDLRTTAQRIATVATL